MVTPNLYPGKFVLKAGDATEPLKKVWVYTDVPGDGVFKLQNFWQTTDAGVGGKLMEDTAYNFYFDGEARDQAWVESKLTEALCTKVTTQKAKDGFLEIEFPKPKFELKINGSDKPEAHYLGWTASVCQLKQTEGPAVLELLLRVKDAPEGGKLSFYQDRSTGPTDTMTVPGKPVGQELEFLMGGKHGHASKVKTSDTPGEGDREKDKDTVLEVVCNGVVVHECKLYIRVRKNANTLTAHERDRFLNALGELKKGAGYQKILQMHNTMVQGLIHGGPSFLPWHRAYLLDLERELQSIDPTVCLHYWNFDQESWDGSGGKTALFTEDFLGKTWEDRGTWTVTFSKGNPLSSAKHDWGTISRQPTWNPSNAGSGRKSTPGWDHENWGAGGEPLNTEAKSAALASFRVLEGNPHNPAHANMMGDLGDVNTAPNDPLFFMLHSNVDRLWALWQRKNNRWDKASNADFSSGRTRDGRTFSDIDGHRLGDTMWPWDQKAGSGSGHYDRPKSKPVGSGMPTSPACEMPKKPGPTLEDMLDYQGRKKAEARIGMDYDSVGFTG